MKNKTELEILEQKIKELQKFLYDETDLKNYWKNLYEELLEKTYMLED